MYNYNDRHIYKPTDIEEVLQKAIDDKDVIGGNGKKVRYYNVPCAFDIETTSFYTDSKGNTYDNAFSDDLEKCAIMYVWQFGINGYCIVGRTWNEFTRMVDVIVKKLQLSENRRLIVYVHNLSFEFQFMRKLFEWQEVFSKALRAPIYSLTTSGVEFRCSYLLSGYSLERLGEQLTKYKCKKLTGNLDYTKIRHTETTLTKRELDYCINDIQVIMCYIQELIEHYQDTKKKRGGIIDIPLTKTGFVRRFCRKNCLIKLDAKGRQRRNFDYYKLMHGKHNDTKVMVRDGLTIKNMAEFDTLRQAFIGGYTYAGITNCIIEDVDSYDIASSYPYVMVSEKYPMGECKLISPDRYNTLDKFYNWLNRFCCVFTVSFDEIQAVGLLYSIPKRKLQEKVGLVTDYSKFFVRRANRITITITNVDFDIICKLYTWESMEISGLYVYHKDYLPTEFVKSVLTLYQKKTELKGVAGKEDEYKHNKEMLNSCYGMCVTNPLRDKFEYEDTEWRKVDVMELTPQEQFERLNEENDKPNRVTSYAWGVFVTAYARKNLFDAIMAMGGDFVYCDTDCVKITNGDAHKDYFDAYAKQVRKTLAIACNYHNISFDMCAPKTVNGDTKVLGTWQFEGRAKRFKAMRGKCYLTEEPTVIDGKKYKYNMTVAGLNKRALPHLIEEYGKDIFTYFNEFLFVAPECAHQNLYTYVDEEREGVITDYQGKTAEYHQFSGINLQPIGYTFSLDKQIYQVYNENIIPIHE